MTTASLKSSLWSIEPMALASIRERAARVTNADLAAAEAKLRKPDADILFRGDGGRIDGSTATIPVMGPIDKRLTAIGFVLGFASSELIRRQVEAMASDRSVRTIVLQIDSPGGTVDGLDQLGDAVFAARQSKRVVAQVDGMAASAAYYVAAQATEVRAVRMDLVGGIGTKLTLLDFSRLYERMGVKVVSIDTGEFKSAGEPGTAITDEHVEYFQSIVDRYFADFLRAVARGRKMSIASVRELADGKMLLAGDAAAAGLVDKLGTLDETLRSLKRAEQNRRTLNKVRMDRVSMDALAYL